MLRKARVLVLAAVTLVASLGYAGSARADAARDEARALTNRASVEFKLAHFQAALDIYSQAYEKYPSPALLFDIGQCHRMLGNYERAVFFFEGYLRDKPDAPNRPTAERLLEESKQALETQRTQARADAQRKAAEEEAARQQAAQPAPSAAPPAPLPEQPQPVRGIPALRIAGFALAGLGVAAIGTGIYFGLRASSDSNELTQLSSQRGTWSDHYQSVYDKGKSSATTATILYIAGGAAIATGGVLAFLGWPRKREPQAAAAITPTSGGAAVTVAGAF